MVSGPALSNTDSKGSYCRLVPRQTRRLQGLLKCFECAHYPETGQAVGAWTPAVAHPVEKVLALDSQRLFV